MPFKTVMVRHTRCYRPLRCPACETTITVEIDSDEWPDDVAYTTAVPWSVEERDWRCERCGQEWHHTCEYGGKRPDRWFP